MSVKSYIVWWIVCRKWCWGKTSLFREGWRLRVRTVERVGRNVRTRSCVALKVVPPWTFHNVLDSFHCTNFTWKSRTSVWAPCQKHGGLEKTLKVSPDCSCSVSVDVFTSHSPELEWLALQFGYVKHRMVYAKPTTITSADSLDAL
jgi:hypothetical protein